ncbi:MAG TPA: T9SS type A sorting domain-containing protein [Bacteroidia bacterium]|jgi:hypothetical protein|nr:T9SS type A sorting domain-containing protein [Bacteroidia bacterium]
MIKKLLSAALLAVTVSATAQQLKMQPPLVGEPVNTANANFRLSGGNQVLNVIDTLRPASVTGCAVGTNTLISGFVFYSIDRNTVKDSGYYFGTGLIPIASATTAAIAQKYPSGTAGLSVTNVLTWAAKAHGGTATTTANIYSENTSTKAPMTILGSSTPKLMSTYTTTGYNNYVFGTPVAVGANVNFFASITIPSYGGTDADTMAIVSTKFGCASVDSLSWMNVLPYGWFSVKYLFGEKPANASNLDLMIWPVVTVPTTGTIAYSQGDLSLYAASPNPASNTVNINFTLKNPSKVDIEVIDITGKVVKTIKGSDTFSSTAKHAVTIDVTNLEAGSYFYSVNANGTKLFSKFVVAK